MPMLAIDHQDSFQKLLHPENPDAVKQSEITDLKQRIIKAAAPYCSGMLLDISTALPAYKNLQKEGTVLPPYFLTYTTTSYSEVGVGERLTDLAYSAQELKDHGAQGTKLFLYVHPRAQTFAEQIAVAKKAQDDSHAVGLPFLLEPVIYERSKEEDKAALLLEAIAALKEVGVEPEVWKVEYPGDAKGCEELQNLVSPTPWILLSRGVSFDQFAGGMKVAAAQGACGFFVGRALWQESVTQQGLERDEFLQKTIPERLQILSEALKG